MQVDGSVPRVCVQLFNRFGEEAFEECRVDPSPSHIQQIVDRNQLKECVYSCHPSDYNCENLCFTKSRAGKLREGFEREESEGCGIGWLVLMIVLFLVVLVVIGSK